MENNVKYYDAVVIGAGNAGLTAATALQRGGSHTLLLERHNIPGGCATSFVRGDYEFEVALHQLSGLGTEKRPFIMRKIFADLGVMDKVDFVQESELYRIVVPGEIDTVLPASWTGLRKKLQVDFPAEVDNIESFLKLCEKITLECFMMLPRARKKNDQAVLKATCPNYIDYGMRSAKDVMDEFMADEKLKTIIAAYWCYIGVPPSDIPFPDLAMMIYAYAAFKPWHIKGGSQAMSSALLESFMEAGGEVRFNCGAEKILTSGDTVRGVVVEGGEEIACSAVVSNASSIITYNELLDHDKPPIEVSEDFKSRRMGTSAFVIYMGLDCTPEELGVTSASNFICMTQDEEKIHDGMQTMDAPSAGMLTCYNFDDRSFAPEGKSIVSLVCLQYGDLWKGIPEEQYAPAKYAYAEKLLDLIAVSFPKIRDHIEELEVATPLTMMRYLNTPDGAIYGFKQNPQDSELFRERIDAISGLYMAGCWNNMGGFQPTYMAGESTARAVLKLLREKKNTESNTENAIGNGALQHA
jgi:prolycopene isomerase